MLESEKQAFNGVINMVMKNYGRTVDTATLTLMFSALKIYTLEEINAAVPDVLRTSEYVPNVATFSKIIEAKRNKTAATDETAAKVAFQALNKTAASNGSHYDWVIEDAKTCIVVMRLWGTPQRFTSLCGDTPRDYMATMKLFVGEWQKITPDDLKDPHIVHNFEGKESDRFSPHVLFCGDYDHCKFIADEFYKPRGMFPKMPPEPRTAVPRLVDKSQFDHLASDGQPVSNRSEMWMSLIEKICREYMPTKNGRPIFKKKS